MTRWLVTGAAGMLGHDLVRELSAANDVTVTALSRSECDITDPAAVRDAVAGHDVVINTASWTDVDGAETHEAAATLVNGDAVASLSAACAVTGARLLHVSTDYVFSGDRLTPYPEDAPTSPVNAYGRSKLVGELAVLTGLPQTGYVVRTAWLYGAHGRNFVSTMLRLSREQATVRVVDDQRGQPTSTLALAHRLYELGDRAARGLAPPGIYHATASGETTWYGLARAVFEHAGLDPDRVQPTTSDQFLRPAARPASSVLAAANWRHAGLEPMAHWRPMLQSALSITSLLTRSAAPTQFVGPDLAEVTASPA